MFGKSSVQPWVAAACILSGWMTLSPGSVLAQSCGPRNTPNTIFPGDPTWAANLNVYPNAVNNGTVAITAANPRSGNGSLQLSTSGSLFDWAFFQRVAQGGAAWGLLSDVNCLTFDWWRDGYSIPVGAPQSLINDLTAETWQEQTPVLRLMVRDLVGDQIVLSQLVWERWYNTRNAGIVPTINDLWHFENLTGQQFWRHFDGGLTYTNAGCADGNFSNSSMLDTYNLGGWATSCYSASAEVYGVMIGVGSWWPGAYSAYLDNVQLAFSGQNSFAVEDNFEFPAPGPETTVPEPGSLVLLATGLLVIAGATLLRRR